MTRSRRRKLMRAHGRQYPRAVLKGLPLASIMLAGFPSAFAQEQQTAAGLQEIVVTAQKREENLQDVPMSIQALGTAKLEELNIQSFSDYAQFLPSVSYQSVAPGHDQITMRGVSSSYSRFLTGTLPTVATYLDEQPVTNIQGTLDVHIYDIARIEALAGPQGTLFGSSSESGTIRIITNKPDPSEFKAAYNLEGNVVDHGSEGYVAQGFVNIPLSPVAAVRLVGWSEHDAGYIDNVPGTRTYPSSGICIANTAPPPPGCVSTPGLAKNNFNGVDTNGARAALKVNLDNNWTISPTVMGQETKYVGVFGYDPKIGDLDVTTFYPHDDTTRWVDASLTVEGKVSNFDVVYTGAYLNRRETEDTDYTDYSLAYDSFVSHYVTDNAGKLINPSQTYNISQRLTSQSHELRVSTPKDQRVRFIGGLFLEHQFVEHVLPTEMPGLADSLTVHGWPNTWFVEAQARTYYDSAAFGELYYDLTPKLTLTAGIRGFKVKETTKAFDGYSDFIDNLYGFSLPCFAPGILGAPCTNIERRYDQHGYTPKLNATYHVDDNKMLYANWARGFRPGGNQVGLLPGGAPPYKTDFLTSYEIGWKTSWAGNRLRFNGAIFQEVWKDFQFNFQGQGGFIIIANAGQARSRGIESDLTWAPLDVLTLTGGLTLLDAKLTENYCGALDANGNGVTNCAAPLAPAGTQLPGSPKFKGNLTARYQFHVAGLNAFVQGAFAYQASAWPDLRLKQRAALGEESPFGVVDFATGFTQGRSSLELFVNNVLDKRAEITRYAECNPTLCAPVATYIAVNQPLTIGLRFGQKF
jgi:iron complex outermembrane recepter protein